MLRGSKGKVVIGGESVEGDLYIAPTVVTEVTAQDSLMQEEIFGPILPIVTVRDLEEAVTLINSREKPLRFHNSNLRIGNINTSFIVCTCSAPRNQ